MHRRIEHGPARAVVAGFAPPHVARLVAALIGLAGAPSPVAAADIGALESPPYVAGELLVRLRATTSAAEGARLATALGASPMRVLLGAPVALWRVPVGQEDAVASTLVRSPLVVYAEPNYRVTAFVTPNDPRFGSQWSHTRMSSSAAWDLATGSANVTIAIVDSGVDETHPDLSAKLVPGYDFVDGDASPHDLNGHGTHVAGIAAALTNNAVGVAGVDWNARIMAIRVLDANGSGTIAGVTEGIVWAYQHGADVVNLSLGTTQYSQALQDAVTAAHAAGSLVVAAMGNDRSGNPTAYPAASEHVMAVAATHRADGYAFYSQYGAHCDLAAPGGEIEYVGDPDGVLSTLPTYAVTLTGEGFLLHYDYLHGTSQAAPAAAGVAALVRGRLPALAPDGVQDLLERTALDLGPAGWDPTYGHGRVDAYAALAAIVFGDGFESGGLAEWSGWVGVTLR